MAKIPILIYNSFYKTMALGALWCEIFAFIGSISGIGAAITNAFIAYDRLECLMINMFELESSSIYWLTCNFPDTMSLRIRWKES